MKKLVLSALLLLGAAGFAAAEKADSYKPTEINYGRLDERQRILGIQNHDGAD